MNESIRITWRGNGREFELFNDKKGKKYLCENRMEKTNDSMKIKFKITKNSNY